MLSLPENAASPISMMFLPSIALGKVIIELLPLYLVIFQPVPTVESALALFCGLYDLEKVLGKKTPFDIVNDLASCILGFDVKNEENLKNCDHLKELSPINFVNENWAETYISMAGKDLFCGGQGEEMVKELARNGVKTTIYKAYNMGETHCSHLLPYKKSSLAWYKSAIDFLDKIKV